MHGADTIVITIVIMTAVMIATTAGVGAMDTGAAEKRGYYPAATAEAGTALLRRPLIR
jgi:hypothetical protein